MRKSVTPIISIGHVELPQDLAEEVLLLLKDPLRNRMRYGALRKLCHQLFANWVEEQRTRQSFADDPTNLPDLE